MNDTLVVSKGQSKLTTEGGLHLPPGSEEELTGTVVAVGPGYLLDNGTTRPLAVQVGDRVLFRKYTGTSVQVHGEHFLVLREEELICAVTE